jgi:osmotically inducible protein OsmC
VSKVLYTAEAHVEGGRADGRARTSDGQLDVRIRPPKELGGDGEGTNPEQLFAVGFASCFESALSAVGRRRKVEASDAKVESKVNLMAGEDRDFVIGVEMDVTLPSIDDAEAAKDIVRAAHKVCPYSNATRGNIDVALRVDGTPLDEGDLTKDKEETAHGEDGTSEASHTHG